LSGGDGAHRGGTVLRRPPEKMPPWRIGRAQRELVELAARGGIKGPVLDAGCGTGENALHFSSLGLDVLGVDKFAPAILKARARARDRGLSAEFVTANALELSGLGRAFQTVIDSGLFQLFLRDERPLYAASLHAALRPGGTYYQLVISDRDPGHPLLPRRVSKAWIEETFVDGWKINFIREARLETTVHADGALAWLSSITRL
jgi:cyclopropane fatty-acyl-phospholipid synthase-like methyltransferase